MRSRVLFLFICLSAATATAQQITFNEIVNLFATAHDYSASHYSRLDSNGKSCALIKVQLPVAGCTFEGDVVGDVKFHTTEYWVYVPENTKRLIIHCPRMETSTVVWETEPGNNGVRSGVTYSLRLSGYEKALSVVSTVPAREGNYLVLTLNPANASVKIDGQQQPPATEGKMRVLLRRGTHRLEASAYGYVDKTMTFTMGDERQDISVSLTSVMASLTVSCATSGAAIYVNDEHKGIDRWKGVLAAGTYRIEARKEGYRSVWRDIVLTENENQSLTLPALTSILGSLQVDYEPIDAEVWLDGKKLGSSPGIFDVQVGRHLVEIRSSGYDSKKLNVTIADGETAALSGSLTKSVASSLTPKQLSSKSSTGTIEGHEYVDLGLSVKWATCNVGADSPSDYGDYYAWGETTTKPTYTQDNSKTYKNSAYNHDIGGDPSLDAARANWGGTWRLPTEAEFQELIDNCTWKWTKQGDHIGYKVTSRRNKRNSIFLPAAGWSFLSFRNGTGEHGQYWSGSIHSRDSNGHGISGCLSFYDNFAHPHVGIYGRYFGCPIRPVSE